MTDSEITLIRYRMERSKGALSAAELMYEEGHFTDAVNRLYYSCFQKVVNEIKRFSNNAVLEKFPLLRDKLSGDIEIWDEAYFVETIG